MIPHQSHTLPTHLGEPMPGVLARDFHGLLSAGVMPVGRSNSPVSPADPMRTIAATEQWSVLAAGTIKQNGGPADTAPRPMSDPLATVTAVDTTGLMVAWREMLADLDWRTVHWRMLKVAEVRGAMGFRPGFKSWGSNRAQVRGFGNAVVPACGRFLAERMKVIL